uniref:Uncharacterized protein n=2 Tax=Nymphaea colorata TaxID=210225 RepID=A0A5K0XGG3_9MAGN
MERLNLKLYLQNRYMVEENERLRKKAILLHQERQALLTELKKQRVHKPSPNPNPGPSPSLALGLSLDPSAGSSDRFANGNTNKAHKP